MEKKLFVPITKSDFNNVSIKYSICPKNRMHYPTPMIPSVFSGYRRF